MREYFYTFENGEYVFYGFEGKFTFRYTEIALLVDKENRIMLKHGSPEMIELIYEDMREKYINAGFNDMAESLMVVKGKFAVDELNKIISNAGYIKNIIERFERGDKGLPVREACKDCSRIHFTNEPLPYCDVEQNIPDWAYTPKQCPFYFPYVQAKNPRTGKYVKISLESGCIVGRKRDSKPYKNIKIIKSSGNKVKP